MQAGRWVPALLGLLVGACSGAASGEGSSRPHVVAAFYPLAFAAEEVGGARVVVTDLNPPAAEPHDLELSPSQVGSLHEADLVVYAGRGFQPALEDALDEVSGVAKVDVLAGSALLSSDKDEEGLSADPHIWLDPVRMEAIARAVSEKLVALDPPGARGYEARTNTFVDRLDKLDRLYRDGLETCERRDLVTAHAAFGYLAERYGLEQVGISGIEPEVEPSPARVAEVADFVRTHGVTTIFFEELLPRETAETLAADVGVRTDVLDPLESPPEEGADYLDVMGSNLASLRAALGCS